VSIEKDLGLKVNLGQWKLVGRNEARPDPPHLCRARASEKLATDPQGVGGGQESSSLYTKTARRLPLHTGLVVEQG